MENNKNYEYLLKDLTNLKGVGIKNNGDLKKKEKLIIYSIYYGDCLNLTRIDQKLVKLMGSSWKNSYNKSNSNKIFFPRIRKLTQ